MLTSCQTLESDGAADWVMKGRVVIIAPEASERLSIYRRQTGDDFEILLTATLGTSVARLVSEGDLHYLDVPNQTRQYADSPARLLFDATGLNLPLDSLIPVFRGQQESGQIGEWQIAILAKTDDGRPELVEARYGDVLIRLTVTEWR